ncbi:MAG: Pycsar system effector family protein [Daejeonella sp.]
MFNHALQRIRDYVRNYFAEHINPNRIYHNLNHTEYVVEWVLKMTDHYKLDRESRFILETSAWFHDLGYFESPDDHERKSAQLAENLLKDLNIEHDVINKVKDCINATKMPQNPTNLLERIICDADMSNLGMPDFHEKSKLVRREFSLISGKKISKEDWNLTNIQFLENFKYKTDFAQDLWGKQLHQNLHSLLKKNETGLNAKHQQALSIENGEQSAKENSQLNDKKNRPDRGIETMFRISSNNHQALSQMADNKAHIMITVNSIIISVLLSVLIRSINQEPHLAIPVGILLMVNVVTIIFSILATRPNIPSGKFTKEDLKSKKINLLFFGNYYKMNLEDFSAGMTELMEDRNFLYGSLIKNLHSQGLVLGKKYHLLRISYNFFMYGLVVSILAFSLAIILKGL